MTSPTQALRDKVIQAIKTVYDPELPVDVYELGLIYEINFAHNNKHVHIIMTLTTPNCPAADQIPYDIHQAIKKIPAIESVKVDLTFDPPYTKKRLSELARLALDL